ncbi:MAG: heat-inducible transcription repressor HrcA [Ignavibacteria bacterium]|nr:heat-inducible transcription repressor HrcA [Ignavibacteria bacterium]
MITLTDREKEVLRYVVDNFILNAAPVGSRSVSKKTDLNLSSATIRNVMSDLEEMEFLDTPHTSAGRIPTDKGYRYYVNSLMNHENVSKKDAYLFKEFFNDKNLNFLDSQDIFNETSRLLGKISHLLSVVSQPNISKGIFEKLEFVSVASDKILVVLKIKSGILKTVIMEITSEIPKSKLEKLSTYINEKLSGLTLELIRKTYVERIGEYRHKEPELIQSFMDSFEKLYADEESCNKIYIGGTGDLIMQPEFENPKNFKEIINLAEDKNLVIHIFDKDVSGENKVQISIGEENKDVKLKNYSVITTSYNFGGVKGNIGVIGPKRMNYAKMVSLLEYTSKLINDKSV